MKSPIAQLALTADDWGLSPGVNAGILDLATKGVISRVGILSGAKYVDEGLALLKALPNVSLGLHFNLSFGRPSAEELSEGDLSPLLDAKGEYFEPELLLSKALLQGFTHRWKVAVQSSLRGQLKNLDKRGIEVRYLDGHEHTHLFPGIPRAIAPILKERGITEVRLPLDSRLRFSKKKAVYWLASTRKNLWGALGWTPRPFYYPVKQALTETFTATLSSLAPGTEVLFHPAKHMDFAELGINDPFRDERVEEYEFLKRSFVNESGGN